MAPNALTAQINKIKAALAREKLAPLVPEPPPFDPGESPPKAAYNFNLVSVKPPSAQARERPSVDYVRNMMRAEMAAYLRNPAPNHMLLVRATPGVGKTTAAVWAALEMARAGKKVQYAGPRHAFFGDVLGAAEHWGGEYHKFWEWLPRQDGDEGRIQHGPKRRTCQYTDAINAWMRKGYKGMDFCSGVCGWDYLKVCEYHRQKGRKEPIIFCQHAHISLGHPMVFNVTIGDENPMGAFTHVRTIKAGDILSEDCQPGQFREMLEALTILTTQNPLDGPDMIQALLKQTGFGLLELTDICQSASMPLGATPAGMSAPRTEAEALDAPVWYTPDLVRLMLRELVALQEERPQVPRIRIGYNQLDLYMRRTATDRLPQHVIWLDATANERIYKALFGRKVKLIKAEPELKGRIFQVWNRANGKGSLFEAELVDDGNGGNKKRVNLTDKAGHANQLIERVIDDRGYSSPAVISFKDLVQTWEFTQTVEHGHFYAARGTNAFEDCDAIFIVGAPLPTLAVMKRTAGILFFERDAAFNTQWSKRNVRYNFTDSGGGWAYPIGNFWGDPDLETVVTAFREEEIIHAAHRVRPVFQETDVWLLTNIPIDDLPPTQLLSMAAVMGAPENANAFKFDEALRKIESWDADVVTTAMLVERLELNRRTATKYVKHLATVEGWEAAAVRTGKRGPMSKGARRK